MGLPFKGSYVGFAFEVNMAVVIESLSISLHLVGERQAGERHVVAVLQQDGVKLSVCDPPSGPKPFPLFSTATPFVRKMRFLLLRQFNIFLLKI